MAICNIKSKVTIEGAKLRQKHKLYLPTGTTVKTGKPTWPTIGVGLLVQER